MNNETSYFFQIISFKKYFYVSLGNNVIMFYCFCGGPHVVEALGNCPVCPPINPALTLSLIYWHSYNLRKEQCSLRKFPIVSV